jgi:phage terminase large subunit GpA-like protein
MLKQNQADLLNRLFHHWAPASKLKTADWANQYRYLAPVEAAKPGKYSTDVTPYWTWPGGPLEALDDPAITEICCQKSAQVGWTSGVLGNAIGKWTDVDPSPILILFPKEGAAKEYRVEKLEPMIEATPRLRAKIDLRSRVASNRQLFVRFPGGFIKMVGSNSPASVKSTPIPRVCVEEPDDCNLNLRGQGDSIKLAKERTKTFKRPKIIIGGTPTLAGVSAIEAEMKLTDQRRGMVPCHECGEAHILDFGNLHCDEDPQQQHPIFGIKQPATAYYVCPHCGCVWDDNQKQRNLRKGWWQATQPCTGLVGYYLNELYSPFPGSRLALLMEKWLIAQVAQERGDYGPMIAFVNSSMGLPYEFQSDSPAIEALQNRAEAYAEKTVPHGGLILTAGVDVQHDRIAVVIRAWGREEESWLVYWGELYGNPLDRTDGIWKELTALLLAAYPHTGGWSLRIRAMSIDSSDGNTVEQVYHWVRQQQKLSSLVLAVKGSSNDALDREIFNKPKESMDLNMRNTKAHKYGLRIYLVGTHRAKQLLDARLKLTGSGPGRLHWYKDVRVDYYEQLTAEVLAPHPRGLRQWVWQKRAGRRNEALDCEIYALHAARALKLHLWNTRQWDDIERQLTQTDLFQSPAVTEPSSASAPPRAVVKKSPLASDDWNARW